MTTVNPQAADDEMTELVDANFPRVDLVGKAANGIPRFLIAKQDDTAGLLDPGFVRDLISKAEPGTGSQEETVTMTGSPAAIAKMIHDAAQASVAKAAPVDDEAAEIAKALAGYEQIIKAKYSADELKSMGGKGQAYRNPDGHYSYPIKDEADLDNAIRAVGRGGADHDAIRAYIIRRAKSLGASSKIPDNWASDGSLKTKVSKDMANVGPELDDGVDGMDPTVPLAAPEDDAPGDPTEPGSPAWEAIDAATAQKWTSIAVRLKNALCVMSDREMLEAVTADPDDAESAFDLQDAMCAVDFVIDTLAGFAVGEQAEADLAGEAMDAIGKAMTSFDAAPLDVIEGLTAVAKSGRVLSSANEQEIRTAAASLNKVLATLPAAPMTDDSGHPVAKKEADMPQEMQADANAAAAPVEKAEDVEQTEQVEQVEKSDSDAQAAASGQVDAGGTTGTGTPELAAPEVPAGREVVKAAKTPQVAVYDASGKLVGIVDAAEITPIQGADAADDKPAADPEPAADGDGGEPQPGPAAAAAEDMEPAPPAEVGTPAEDVAKAAPETDNDDMITVSAEVLKSIVAEGVTAVFGDMSEQVELLKSRLATVEKQPAASKVFVNGQVPPAHQLRGQDQGAAPVVDVAKALERKQALYGAADATDQNRVAQEMQGDAIAALAAKHRR